MKIVELINLYKETYNEEHHKDNMKIFRNNFNELKKDLLIDNNNSDYNKKVNDLTLEFI